MAVEPQRAQEARIDRGLRQASAVWRASDGDFAAWARKAFVSDEKKLDATFARLEGAFEQVDGAMNDLGREMRRASDLDVGPMLDVDPVLAGWDPGAHVADDLFENSAVSDATWATLSKTCSTEQLMDAVFTVGQYNLVSWALNSFGVPLDDFLPQAKK